MILSHVILSSSPGNFGRRVHGIEIRKTPSILTDRVRCRSWTGRAVIRAVTGLRLDWNWIVCKVDRSEVDRIRIHGILSSNEDISSISDRNDRSIKRRNLNVIHTKSSDCSHRSVRVRIILKDQVHIVEKEISGLDVVSSTRILLEVEIILDILNENLVHALNFTENFTEHLSLPVRGSRKLEKAVMAGKRRCIDDDLRVDRNIPDESKSANDLILKIRERILHGVTVNEHLQSSMILKLVKPRTKIRDFVGADKISRDSNSVIVDDVTVLEIM